MLLTVGKTGQMLWGQLRRYTVYAFSSTESEVRKNARTRMIFNDRFHGLGHWQDSTRMIVQNEGRDG
jgi:hypothetical protein